MMEMGPLPMVQHQPLYKAYYEEYTGEGIDIRFFDGDDEE